MGDIQEYYWEWTECDEVYHTGLRIVKSNVPPEILKELIKIEIKYFEHTWRRELLNIDLEKGELISIEEGVKRYRAFLEEKRQINK